MISWQGISVRNQRQEQKKRKKLKPKKKTQPCLEFLPTKWDVSILVLAFGSPKLQPVEENIHVETLLASSSSAMAGLELLPHSRAVLGGEGAWPLQSVSLCSLPCALWRGHCHENRLVVLWGASRQSRRAFARTPVARRARASHLSLQRVALSSPAGSRAMFSSSMCCATPSSPRALPSPWCHPASPCFTSQVLGDPLWGYDAVDAGEGRSSHCNA